MSTQLEKIQAVIYKARWVDGGIATDKAIAEAVLESLQPPVLHLPHSNEYKGYVSWTPVYDVNDYSPDSPHYGKPHEDCCK